MSDLTKWRLTAGIFAALFVLSLMRPITPDPVCLDQDMAIAERSFASCVSATGGHDSTSPWICRSEAVKLSCKSWSRP